MNIEQAIEILSALETEILKSKDGNSAKYGQGYGTITMYKNLVQITNFIDESQSGDYTLRSLIKKFNDIKNVMACELYKKFLLLDFTKDFYINTEILASVSVIYGNLYRNSLINEFCSNAINHLIEQQDPTGGSQYICKLLKSFSQILDSDKVDMFSDDWNISYYLYVEFKKYICNHIKNLQSIGMKEILMIADSIRDLETHVKETLEKKHSNFTLDVTICTAFDENQYCSNLYLENVRTEITKFKENLITNFNIKYNTGKEEYLPSYKNIIMPFNTAIDVFTFVRKIIGHTAKVSSGKIYKNVCNELFGVLKHYGVLLISVTNCIQESGFNKITEFALFSTVSTCRYCMIAIDSMDENLRLSEQGISIEKIKLFYSNDVFIKTINLLAKETVNRTKQFTLFLQSTKFEERNDKKEVERVKLIEENITKYTNEILKIYGDTRHAFIGKSYKGLEEFCFTFVFKSVTYQLLDNVIFDLLGIKNVSSKYSDCFYPIFEKLLERIHSLLVENPNLSKYQNDIDTKLTRIKKIIDAISIVCEYTKEEHAKIFSNDNISFENILSLKGQTGIINIPNISEIKVPNLPNTGIQTLTKNPVTNAVKNNVGKFGTFMSGRFDSMLGKDGK